MLVSPKNMQVRFGEAVNMFNKNIPWSLSYVFLKLYVLEIKKKYVSLISQFTKDIEIPFNVKYRI